MDEEETISVQPNVEDAYPPNSYSISAPEDPVFFASQQTEPVAPAPEDPSVTPTIFIANVVPIPISEADGIADAVAATDPSGAELPPSLTFNSIFPSVGLPFEGGTICTITGTNLNLVNDIRIVGTTVPFVYIDPNTLQITTPVSPDNSAGSKTVDLFDAFGVLQASAAIVYDPQVAVFGVASVVPNSGSMLGGDVVVLNGAAFFFIASVTFAGEPVFDYQIQNSTSMRIVTPPGLVGAPVEIRVTSYDGTTVVLPNAFTYTYPPPFLLGLDRNSADVAGGTQVQLAGAFLQGATDVQVGGVSVTFTVVNAGTIVFETASSTFTGIPLDVTVTTPNGTDTLFGAFTYSTTAPVPKIQSVSPPKGIIGAFTSVVVTGSGFTGAVQVEFDGVAASSFSVESDTRITCTAPFGFFNGGNAVPVKVTTMDGSFTRVNSFTYVYDVPTVASTTLTTDLVEGGTSGSLFGTNFYEVSSVTVAGVPVRSYTVVSPTQIDYVTGTAPNDSTSPGDIQVITLFGIGTLSAVFTYTYPVVTLTGTSLSTGFASGGATVVLTGTGFTLVTQVLIAGIAAASFTVDSLTQITCVTAANANPTNTPGDIQVNTVFTQVVLPNAFTYTPTLTLTSCDISNGVTTGGEAGVLTGSNFANIQNIFLAGQAVASFTVVNSTTITFLTGASNTYGVLGDIVVVTTFGENVVLTNAFVYYPALSVTSVDINRGLSTGGQTRTLTGTGFASVTGVTVCGVAVTSFTVVTPTTLTFVTAPNATLGTGSIVVTTTYVSSTLSNGFTYHPAMQVTSTDVSSGPAAGGTTVVVSGSGFFQVNSVTLNGTSVTSFVVDSLTQITCVTASKVLADGETGDIVVTSPYTSDTLVGAWTYWPAMTVVSLDVSNGPTTGGTTVIVTGTGFYAVTSVTFNNIAVASYTVDSPTQITAVTGIGGLNGTGNVVVNSIYTSATKSSAWTYWQPMAVTTLSVSNGPRAGGTSVVVTGSGFFSVTSVTFNGVAVASYTVNSLTQITVVTGAKVSSNGDVGNVVVTSTYTSGTGTNLWTYYPPMSIASIDVPNGITTGGATVVITGAGFYSVTGVTFVGAAVASFTVDSLTQITVTTGTSSVTSPTTGDVVVTSSYTSATGTNLWLYYPPVVVSSLDVSYGKVSGGTTVNITGSGFYSVNSVTFKGIEVLSKTVNSPTSITVTVKGDVAQLVGRNSYMGAGPPTSNFIGSGTFHCWAGGSIQKWIVPGTYVYTSSDAVTFTVADVPTPGSLRYAMYVPSLGKAYVIGNGNFANRFLESTDGIAWTSPGVLPINRSWNWAAYSPSLDVFVVVDRSSTASPFAVSTDRGATWTTYGTGTNRGFATVVWSTAIGKFVASGFNTVSTGIIAHSADGITWTEVDLATLFPSANVGLGQTAGVSEDLGVVVFSSGGNAFTWDGTTWQTGTTTGQINNPVWVPSVYAFVGLGSNIVYRYSSDGLTWTDVSVNSSGANVYGSFAYSPEQDVFLATGTTSSWNFTSPDISTNASVVVTSTYTSGTKANAWAFVPTMAISDVDIGYGPTTGSTTVKIYGRGFRNINPGSVTFNGIQATSFTNDGSGCLITAVTAAGTAGTGNIVCANSFRSATLTNGWSYKNVSVSSYDYDALTAPAKTSLSLVLQMRPVLSTYTGPLFRVWRVSDGAVTDVYASSGDPVDWFTKNGASVAAFEGASTLKVVRWFDQSGNSLATADGVVPSPPNAGATFGYAYQPRWMPTLDLTNRCLDLSGGSCFLQLQNNILPLVTSPYTITVRHGTVGNSTNGEFWNVGTNTNTPPGSGNYLRRQGSNYVNNWPGVNALTLTGSYANNQVVTFTNDLATRTGYVQGTSTASVAGTLAGDTTTLTVGGRGDGTTDSLAQLYLFAYASTVFGASDLAVLEDTALYTFPPTVTSVDVPSGSTSGGTTVVITGTNFTGATGVTFNGTSAASYTVDSATQITAVTAAGSAGRGDIVVSHSSGNATFTNGWTYISSNYTRYFAVTDISTTTNLATGSSWLATVAYNSSLDRFIVGDTASGVAQPFVTSSDATTWTRQTASNGVNDSVSDIAVNGTTTVSVGVAGVIRRSTNTTSWTVTTAYSTPFRIAYSPSLSRWAVGRGGTTAGLFYSNDDGVTFTAATGAAVYVACVIWNTALAAFYVFIRNGGSVYSSTNGTAYTLAANNVLASDNYHAAAYSSDRNEMVTIGNYSANVYTSSNGTTWTLRSTITGAQVVGVTWSTELYMYVACTDKGLYASVDATVWVPMNPLTWSGTFDYSWGRWVYSPVIRKGIAAYCNKVFRSENTTRASLSFAASQNVQVTNDADLRPGAGDFTVEWFQYQTTPTAGTTPYVFSIANDLAVSVNGSSGVMSVYVGGSAVITHTPTSMYNRWCHLAVTRTGTTLGLFKDGNRLSTVTNSTNIANTTDVLRIGNSSTTSANNQFLGRVTNFHVVKGTALYTTATYTVPTREIFAVANTKLLLTTPSGNLTGNYAPVTKTVTNNSATTSTYNPFYL